tara:strand:+ start:197 stop:928 length:732 start_codon:yes stop_codon:yes gene_type:complete
MGLGLGLGIDLASYKSFTLTDISNLSLWLQHNVGVTNAKWDDSSGNNNHVTQSTEANQASHNDIHGGLDFEATESDHYDLTSAITIAERGGFCLAVVLELESNSGTNTILGKDSNDQIRIDTSTTFTIRANDPSDVTTSMVFPNGTFATATKMLLLVNRSISSSNVFSFFKNGVALTADTDTSSNEAQGENPNGFDINVLGAKSGTSNFFDGKILELAFWSKGLSAQEIADVNSYLKSFHGIN